MKLQNKLKKDVRKSKVNLVAPPFYEPSTEMGKYSAGIEPSINHRPITYKSISKQDHEKMLKQIKPPLDEAIKRIIEEGEQ